MAPIQSHGYVASNISATTSSFDLMGGRYAVQINATWGGGNVVFGRLSPDGTNYIPISTYTANTYEIQDIPNGTYKLTVTTSTAIYAEIVAIAAIQNGGV